MSAVIRRPVAVVIGGQRASATVLREAEALGAGLMKAGFRVATGGRGGVMEAASRGAQTSPHHVDGGVIGVLPTLDPNSGNPWLDIVVPTGMQFARNTLLVAMADVVIAVAGGAGTLSEIALAWQHGTPVIALDQGEGWSAKLAGTRLDDRNAQAIVSAPDAPGAIHHATQLVKSSEAARGFR